MTLYYINDDDFDSFNDEAKEQIAVWNNTPAHHNSMLYCVLRDVDDINIQSVMDYSGWSYEGSKQLVAAINRICDLMEERY